MAVQLRMKYIEIILLEIVVCLTQILKIKAANKWHWRNK